jgi:transcriptional regulator with XRE-family HTH domain
MEKVAASADSPSGLRAYRQDLRLSQTDLARRSDVSRFKINQYENGAGELTIKELQQIQAALQDEIERLRRIPSPAGGGAAA